MHYTSTPLLSPLRYFCTPALPTEHEISICDLDAIYPLKVTCTVHLDGRLAHAQATMSTSLLVFDDILLGSSVV
jgi:hypothetical protein